MDNKKKALSKYLEVDINDIQYEGVYYVLNTYIYSDQEYAIAEGIEEVEIAMEKNIENYIDDRVLIEIPEQYRDYFNNSSFVVDMIADKTGHILVRYDGQMGEVEIGGIDYYIFRI